MNQEQICEGTLIDGLYRYFVNYSYLLSNSFVFQGWESDFLAMSKSGYWVEVEVKISRSDFFKDFDKGKHGLFKSLQAGKTFHVEPWSGYYTDRGDLLGQYYSGKLINYGNGYAERQYGPGVVRGNKDGESGFWTNQFDRYQLRKERHEVYAPTTPIRFVDLGKVKVPHQFYYCCPAGMIKKTEIPEYAGLLEYQNCDIVSAKRAPYMHKRPMEMHGIMAHKFYQLWRYKANHGRNIKIVTP